MLDLLEMSSDPRAAEAKQAIDQYTQLVVSTELSPTSYSGRSGPAEESFRDIWLVAPQVEMPSNTATNQLLRELGAVDDRQYKTIRRAQEKALLGKGFSAEEVKHVALFRRYADHLKAQRPAIAAKLAFPTAPVVCFSGDGDFQMTGMEFSTAVQAEAAVVVLVIDNGIYGTIRMHQERAYPGRVIATRLENPDFAALAVACGGYGERVETTDDFGPAFDRAVASGKPAILHILIDPRAIAPGKVLPEG